MSSNYNKPLIMIKVRSGKILEMVDTVGLPGVVRYSLIRFYYNYRQFIYGPSYKLCFSSYYTLCFLIVALLANPKAF